MLRRALVFVFLFPLIVPGGASALADWQAAAPQARVAKAAAVTPTFFVSGRGWGHGVGLSQWGAYGFAQRGTPYARILAHYYRGTALARAPVSKVRVLLRDGAKTVTISSKQAFRVRDGDGTVHDLEPGAYTFGFRLKIKLDPDAEAETLPGPLLFSPGTAALVLDRLYRGQLQVFSSNGRLRVVNHVGLEPYLYGVVPREMPYTWPVEALKAQAVVARSYALAVRRTTGVFDLYADTRSQVYGGIAAEKPSSNAAVDATAGQIVTYNGKVATTYFFSTSGGRTASVGDVWEGSQAIPYLVSVPDPYDSASPHHEWGPFAFTAKRLTSAFKVPGRVIDLETVVNPSERVDTLIATGTRGRVTVAGGEVRRILGLRSTWFRVGALGLEWPAKPVTYGGELALGGIARGLGKVSLEQRVAPKVWEPAARLTAKDGRVSVTVKPLSPTFYRLSAGGSLTSAPVRVGVAPRVRFRPVELQTELRGVVRPVLAAAKIEIQRQDGTVWRTVSTTQLDAAGTFVARVQLVPGNYRACIASTRGFSTGYSPVLRVLTG